MNSQKAWSILRSAGERLWDVICWLIIPVVFGYFCYASIARRFDVSMFQILLAVLALLPWLLRLFARYLSEFTIGPQGVSGKTRQAVKNSAEIDEKGMIEFTNVAPSVKVESELGKLLAQAKKVLRTLWKFQVEQFGPDDMRRWGFTVGAGASDYNDFSLGVLELLHRHLVATDQRGFVFLTNEGISFCKANNSEIVQFPHYYSRFGN
jgi:hypothetical protein